MKPQRVQALQDCLNPPSKDFLTFQSNDVITVLDKKYVLPWSYINWYFISVDLGIELAACSSAVSHIITHNRFIRTYCWSLRAVLRIYRDSELHVTLAK